MANFMGSEGLIAGVFSFNGKVVKKSFNLLYSYTSANAIEYLFILS